MAKINFLPLISFVFISLLSGCLENTDSFFGTPIPTSSSTPTVTQTPTSTLTPTITVTSTITMTATPSSTPYPLSTCNDSKPYIATWSTEKNGMQFKAFACSDNTLIAIFHNQEFGETITINQGTANKKEYAWEVHVDVDADDKTGSSDRYYLGITGADYSLSLARWVYGRVKTVPFAEAFQINVWKFETGSIKMFSNAEWFADHANKMIILRGIIPELNANSKIVFSRYRFRLDDRLSYKTDWIESNLVP